MIVDNLKNSALYESLHPCFPAAFEFMRKALTEDVPVGKTIIDGDRLFVNVQEYDTKTEGGRPEAHRNYIDIQFVLRGIERMPITRQDTTTTTVEYNPEKDVEFFAPGQNDHTLILRDCDFAILYPDDLHTPGMAVDNVPVPVKKFVVKVRID